MARTQTRRTPSSATQQSEGKKVGEFVRPTRPPKTPSGPFGGWMKDPPSFCKFKKVDKEGVWAETTICGTICKDSECLAYMLLKEGERIRLKLMNTNKLEKKCPYCKAPLLAVSKDDVTYTYACTTTGDRVEQAYARRCARPNKERKLNRRGR